MPPVPFWTAPGTSDIKLKSCRDEAAMFVRASLSSANERSPLVDWTSVTRLVTLTSSVIWPTSSVSVPVVILSLAFTTTFVRSSVLNPCRAAWSV